MDNINILVDDLAQFRDQLHPFICQMAMHVKPLLMRIDQNQITGRSLFNIDKKKGLIIVLIDPKDSRIPLLRLDAEKSRFTLGGADIELLECHSKIDESEYSQAFKQLYEYMEKYLSGITIIEHYNRKNVLLKKEYFWGLNTESDLKTKIGNMYCNPIARWFSKVDRHEKLIYSFIS